MEAHPGRWALDLALAQRKHAALEVELVVQLPGASRDATIDVEGIPVHYLACPTSLRSACLFLPDSRRMRRALDAIDPDIVHAHGTEDAYGITALRSGRPYVITMQGVFGILNRKRGTGLISREKIVEILEERCLRRSRFVVAKSNYVKSYLAGRYPNLELRAIPNTYDPALLEVDRPAVRQDAICYVGTMSPWKGIDVLQGALSRLSRRVEVELWVMGDRPGREDEFESKMKQSLKDMLGEKVTFLGTVPRLEVAARVARAKCLAAPSVEDMFGNQVIEALLMETPVVVTEGTALAENVRRFGNGTVVPQQDPEALARAIEETLRAREFPEAASAREAVMDALSPERVAGAHRELYEEVLGG